MVLQSLHVTVRAKTPTKPLIPQPKLLSWSHLTGLKQGLRNGHYGIQVTSEPSYEGRPKPRSINDYGQHNMHRDVRGHVEDVRLYPRSEERRVGKECRSRWSP